MTNTIEAVDGQVADPRKVRKVVAAGCVGIFVELYDNGVFAFMATAWPSCSSTYRSRATR